LRRKIGLATFLRFFYKLIWSPWSSTIELLRRFIQRTVYDDKDTFGRAKKWPNCLCQTSNQSRVARWYTYLQTKIPTWVTYGESCSGRCWYILWPFGIFYGELVYFVVIWYILWSFGIFWGHLVCYIASKIWQP
jgi:hypothetical protein